MTETILRYLAAHYIELLASLFGVIYVILAIRENIWCWIAGIVNVSLYIFVFWQSRIYGMMGLQTIYLLMSIYGLILWAGFIRRKNSKGELPVTNMPGRLRWMIFGATLIAALLTGYLLSFTDNQIPYMDGLTSAMGLAATWMTARKYLENWLVWIVNDAICVALYAYMGLWLTMVLYLIFAIMAVVGYFAWKKSMKTGMA
ncbi:MAG: nicotinamide riboside transporter PnuC [Bacteroidales bacterium]